MTAENPFETHFREYDAWFDAHRSLFESELLAIRSVLPVTGFDRVNAVEIGVGSGRFAEALGVPLGIEPADGIAALARARGIRVIKGTAESLPLDDRSVSAAFLITVSCFLERLAPALRELRRVLSPVGFAVIGFLPLDGAVGRLYAAAADADPFFRHAHLRSRCDMAAALRQAGFAIVRSAQTLLETGPTEKSPAIEAPRDGWDVGSFVALRVKPLDAG
jgi:SAM-dependent methyltransferase